ncbi:unnamed protein product [Closterium sp. Naga37s-1]|nr:unnamed protein product [Closterium sp. Naga37s-1]
MGAIRHENSPEFVTLAKDDAKSIELEQPHQRDSQQRRESQQRESQQRVVIPPASLRDELVDAVAPIKSLLDIDDLLDHHDGPSRESRRELRSGSGIGFRSEGCGSYLERVRRALFHVFPILQWLSEYKLTWLPGDVVAGFTITSLAIPQDLGYAQLAHVPPINGLYGSFIPPTVYAIFGTSRHMAIAPVAIVSLLMGELLSSHYNPESQPSQYLRLAFTSTFFAGVFQLAMGLLRLGFVVDLLCHPVVVGFMGGAAVTIGLQQLKGLLGYATFTTKANVQSVLDYVFSNTYLFNWRAFVIGMAVLLFLLSLRFLAHHFKPHPRLGKPLFYLNCLGPILAVTATSLAVYLLGGGNKPPYNIPTVKPLPAGIASFGSLTQLQLSGPDCAAAASIGIVAALIALAEAAAIARMFATLEGYKVDGIREMVALGMANIGGSFSSTYVVTGSFSRSAVNYNSGGKTALTNVIMSALVLVTLVAVTPAFQYLPTATLSAIIIVAVAGLVDFTAMALILKTDKVDFLITLGTALGILFVSMEIGLLIGVLVSMVSFFVQVARPKMPTLGLIKGTGVYRSVEQYGDAEEAEGVWVMRVDGPLLFPSASYVRQRVLRAVERSTRGDEKRITHVVLECTSVTDLDTTAIHALQDLLSMLHRHQVQLVLTNPATVVLRKLALSGFMEELGEEWLFLSVAEAVAFCQSVAKSDGV